MQEGDGFQQKLLEKAYFIVKMTGLAIIRPAVLTFGKRPKLSLKQKHKLNILYLN